MNEWDSLPNGKHIYTVLEFVRTHPYAEWDATRAAARSAAWGAVWGAAWDAAWDAVWDAARDAVFALVAWDYAGDLFTADLGVVELAAHGGDPAAILLLPLKRVMDTHNGEQNESA